MTILLRSLPQNRQSGRLTLVNKWAGTENVVADGSWRNGSLTNSFIGLWQGDFNHHGCIAVIYWLSTSNTQVRNKRNGVKKSTI